MQLNFNDCMNILNEIISQYRKFRATIFRIRTQGLWLKPMQGITGDHISKGYLIILSGFLLSTFLVTFAIEYLRI